MPILLFILGIIALDQISKYYIQQTMQLGLSIPVLDGFFHITYILNAGAAFGILENQRWFFIFTAVFLLLAALRYWQKIKKQPVFMQLGIAMMLGGAAGNVIDRTMIGSVVDFIDFRVWPIFNIADIFIVVGVILIMYMLFKENEQTKGGKDSWKI